MEVAETVIVGLVGIGVGALLASWRRLTGSAAEVDDTDSFDVFLKEIERARRYERSLALLWLPKSALASGVGPDPGGRRAAEELNGVVASLRSIDLMWVGRNGVHILLPEAGRTEAEACTQRLLAFDSHLDGDAVRVAVFPDDGVTTGALFAQLADDVELLPDRSDLPSRRLNRHERRHAS